MWSYWDKISLQGNAGPSQETALCRTREGLARDGEASSKVSTPYDHMNFKRHDISSYCSTNKGLIFHKQNTWNKCSLK